MDKITTAIQPKSVAKELEKDEPSRESKAALKHLESAIGWLLKSEQKNK